MANPTVKCTVDQCTHYMPGDQCMAAKISVYNNEQASYSSQTGDTQCQSFHQRKTVGDMVGAVHNSNIGGMITGAFLDGKQVTPEVECFVSHCAYWHQNNICQASSIEVAGYNAVNSQDTDCKTFKAK